MLDIHTINKTLDWLKVRRDQTEKSGNCIGGLPHFEVQAKVKIIEDLIEELSGKASDLQTAIDAGGKHGNLIKEKEGKYITIYRCPTCGGKRNVRREYFAEVHIRILKKLFQYCVDNRTHLIQTRDIKTLNHVDYSMFAKLQRYGFIYFPDGRDNRKKDGRWWVAVTRIYDFLNNDWTVAEYSEKDTVSKEQHTSDTRKTIKEIRSATFDHAREYQENLPTHLQYLEWMEDLTKL